MPGNSRTVLLVSAGFLAGFVAAIGAFKGFRRDPRSSTPVPVAASPSTPAAGPQGWDKALEEVVDEKYSLRQHGLDELIALKCVDPRVLPRLRQLIEKHYADGHSLQVDRIIEIAAMQRSAEADTLVAELLERIWSAKDDDAYRLQGFRAVPRYYRDLDSGNPIAKELISMFDRRGEAVGRRDPNYGALGVAILRSCVEPVKRRFRDGVMSAEDHHADAFAPALIACEPQILDGLDRMTPSEKRRLCVGLESFDFGVPTRQIAEALSSHRTAVVAALRELAASGDKDCKSGMWSVANRYKKDLSGEPGFDEWLSALSTETGFR